MTYILKSTEDLQGFIRKTVEELLDERLQKPIAEKPKHPLDDYLDAREAAEYLRLSLATVYTMTCKRQIPFCKQGKKLYFRRNEIMKWMEIHRPAETAMIPDDSE
ncbi:MAG: helix-turn-helix domain-containing protein [Bacteroidia bacterium]|nr:helix-turn-helix domain-containing protein [Bacteroidia bacterium]